MYIQPQVLHISSVISGDSKRCFFMNFWPLITTDHWHQAVDVWKPRFCAVELSLEIRRSRWTGSGWMGMVVFVPLEAVANEKVGFLHAIVFQLWLRISDIFLDIGDCANLVVDTMPFVKLTIWHRPRPLPTGRLSIGLQRKILVSCAKGPRMCWIWCWMIFVRLHWDQCDHTS